MSSYDVIIIGSGFGGSVMACRLAEKGAKVLVLERGRRWDPKDYPREANDAWLYDHDQPEKQNGWIDFRAFPDMAIAQGAGVGGGSLIYANISVEAPAQIFNQGWPDEITYNALKPYYDVVGKMLNTQEIPDNQLTERYKLMREGAQAIGARERFSKLPIAVTFDPDWNYDLDDRFNHKHSKEWTNDQGQKQGTCVHLGNCDIGCDVKAKNTLDLNYIPWAEKHGAEVRELHIATKIEPDTGGYRVYFDRLENGKRISGNLRAEKVILAAGSLNSTELLFRCRDEYKTLPNISQFLGKNWSSNGDFLTPAFYEDRVISPSHGPTISSAIDFLDGSEDGAQFFIEDGGFPDVLRNALKAKVTDKKWKKYQLVIDHLNAVIKDRDPLNNMMPWFAQGIDAADGELSLGRKWYWPFSRNLKLDWDIDRSEEVINAIVNMHKRLSAATGGDPWVPPSWTILKNLVTPHPLGGCNMGSTPSNGVVNHMGEVFNYKNLYVMDSAVIPEAIGRNPTRTIAALAERAADLINT